MPFRAIDAEISSIKRDQRDAALLRNDSGANLRLLSNEEIAYGR